MECISKQLTEYDILIIQPTLQIIRKHLPTLQKGLDILTDVALKTLQFTISGGLLYTWPGPFLIGTTCGTLYPELMKPAIDRILKIWKKHYILLTAFAFIAPFSLCITSSFVGANISLRLVNWFNQKS